MQYLFGILIFLTSTFLILLVLIQRGRGGGLAGALGGMGGQSAFGTKAGDLFTRITIAVAAVWILLSVAAIAVLNQSNSVFGQGGRSVFSTGSGSGTPAGSTTVPGTSGISAPETGASDTPASDKAVPDKAAPDTSASDKTAPAGAAKEPELETGSKTAKEPAGESKAAPKAEPSDSTPPDAAPSTPDKK